MFRWLAKVRELEFSLSRWMLKSLVIIRSAGEEMRNCKSRTAISKLWPTGQIWFTKVFLLAWKIHSQKNFWQLFPKISCTRYFHTRYKVCNFVCILFIHAKAYNWWLEVRGKVRPTGSMTWTRPSGVSGVALASIRQTVALWRQWYEF